MVAFTSDSRSHRESCRGMQAAELTLRFSLLTETRQTRALDDETQYLSL